MTLILILSNGPLPFSLQWCTVALNRILTDLFSFSLSYLVVDSFFFSLVLDFIQVFFLSFFLSFWFGIWLEL